MQEILFNALQFLGVLWRRNRNILHRYIIRLKCTASCCEPFDQTRDMVLCCICGEIKDEKIERAVWVTPRGEDKPTCLVTHTVCCRACYVAVNRRQGRYITTIEGNPLV